MRSATPLRTWSSTTLGRRSARSCDSSTPRFTGPGCITIASSFAKRSFARSSPKVAEYSRTLGNSAPASRSSWMRSAITTSAPSSASRSERKNLTPSVSTWAGIMVGGPATRTSAPILVKA